jgi:cytochrome c-type biogenesis protein CcmH
MARRRWLAAPLLALLLAAPLRAQSPETGLRIPPMTPAQEATAHEAMTRLRSPVTPFHTVDMCPSPEATALRDTIRLAAAEGESSDRIVEGVVARYGEQVRLLPKKSGVGLLAWVAPIAVLLAGLGLVVWRLRRGRAVAAPLPVASSAVSDVDRSRIRDALRELEMAEEVDG